MYAKLNNGVIEYAPTNYTLSDGRVIVNFNKSEVLMKKYGFKEVIDNPPSFNQATEYLVISGYTETDVNIIVEYAIKQMDMIEQEATIKEEIAQLKVTDADHELAIAEMMDIVNHITSALSILGGE